MIYSLRRKFILISALSLLAVLILIFAGIVWVNAAQMNKNLDSALEELEERGGRPGPGDFRVPMDSEFEDDDFEDEFAGDFEGFPERGARGGMLASVRYFSVMLGQDGKVLFYNMDLLNDVSEEDAREMAAEAAASGGRGWLDEYRYLVSKQDDGKQLVLFADGSMNRSVFKDTVLSTALLLFGSGLVVFCLIWFFSGRAVKPVAESYEKQKQFITDANHELKTPLTLILTNLDIAQEEVGENEWLADARYEAGQMTSLVERLVTLSRMDEEGSSLKDEEVPLGEAVLDLVSEFVPAAEKKDLRVSTEVDESVTVRGDESALRQLTGILLDNAVKYCDPGGEIRVSLTGGRKVNLSVENTYAAVGETELDRLFDRFYRADKARTSGSGFGVGLSIARAIAEKHKGKISAYQKDEKTIGFSLSI